jgi:hypothetical protein
MNAIHRDTILQRWTAVQNELLPQLRVELEWVRLEAFTRSVGAEVGRPPHERAWLANAFVAGSGWTRRTAALSCASTADRWGTSH